MAGELTSPASPPHDRREKPMKIGRKITLILLAIFLLMFHLVTVLLVYLILVFVILLFYLL